MPGRPVNRAAIKNALLTRLAAATFASPIAGLSTWAVAPSRRLQLWNQVQQQPAAFLVQHTETYETNRTGHLVRRWLDMGMWCYARTGDEAIIGDDLLDLMEGAIEAQMQPDRPEGELTLGGLVSWCRITRENNMFRRDPGDLDGQALLILPVRILIP